jgi:hypothetical protein
MSPAPSRNCAAAPGQEALGGRQLLDLAERGIEDPDRLAVAHDEARLGLFVGPPHLAGLGERDAPARVRGSAGDPPSRAALVVCSKRAATSRTPS